MDENLNILLAALDKDIENKCLEIQQKRKEKVLTQLFILLCLAVIIVPTLLVFLGISLTFVVAPILFISISFLILCPILLNQQGGHSYEQI